MVSVATGIAKRLGVLVRGGFGNSSAVGRLAGLITMEPAQGFVDKARVEPAGFEIIGQPVDQVGIGGIRVERPGDGLKAQTALHGHHELLEDKGRLRPDDGGAEDLTSGGYEQLGEAFGAAVDPGTCRLGELGRRTRTSGWRSLAAASVRPTLATSGSMNVIQGSAE